MTSSGLFIEGVDGLRSLHEAVVELEDDLQALVARHPELLSGDDDTAAGRRWLLVRREQGIASAAGEAARFSLDHLFVDQDGTPTLVEVKRAVDTRARREVVAQMLDYAANALAFLDAGELRASFNDRHDDPNAVIRERLGASVEPDDLWRHAEANLRTGNLRLIFLADRIPRELKTLVEFLNEQMKTMEVLAIEVATFEAEGTRVLRARTIGQTQAAQAVKGRRPRTSWDRSSWMRSLTARAGTEVAAVAHRLLAFADARGLSEIYGKGSEKTAVQLGIKRSDAYLFPFLFFNDGSVEVGFHWMATLPYPPFHQRAKREELLLRLNAVEGIDVLRSKVDGRPSFQLSVLVNEGAYDGFEAVFSWALDEAEASGIGVANLDLARTETPPGPLA